MAIWLGTDFHLYKYDYRTGKPRKNKYFDVILRNLRRTLKEDDLFLFLGDLAGSSVKELGSAEDLRGLLKDIPGYKIMIRGNNDELDDASYYTIGFDKYCCGAAVLGNVLFTHNPVQVKYPVYNIHGHNHGRSVKGKSNRNFDAWSNKGELIPLYKAMQGHHINLSYNIAESGQELHYVDWHSCVKVDKLFDISKCYPIRL